MTDGSGDYITALRNTEEYSDPAIGFTHTSISRTVRQVKTLIAQNNVIISLLIGIHSKINNIMTIAEHNTQLNPELDKIISMIETLKVGDKKRPTTGPVKFATNIKPTE